MAYKFCYREVAESLYLSLNHEPFYQVMIESVSDDPALQKEALMRYFDYSIIESQTYGEVVIPDGMTYGASIWSKPTDEVLAQKIKREKSDFIRQYLGDISLKSYLDIVGFMSEKAKAIVPAGCWYLSILGVTPAMQGKGLGSVIVKPVLETIDRLGVPSYLETFSYNNLHFYGRLGYKEAASFVEPVTSGRYWIMLREPSPCK